jgi:hypothetical protein
MGGAAGLDKVLIAIVSGLATITTGGAATLSKTKAYGVSGGLNTGGAATTAFGTSIHTYTHVSGGLVMGGTAVTAGSGAPKKTEWGGTIFVPSQVTTGRKVEKPKEQPQPKVFAYTGWATQAIVHSGSASASRTSVFTHSAIKKSNVVAFRPRGSAVIEKRFIHEYVPATHQQTTKINLSAPERKIVRFRNVEQVAKDAVRQKHEELMILLKLAR